MKIELRGATAEDEAFIRRLLLATLADELQAWAWPDGIRDKLLDTQYRIRRDGVAANFPGAATALIIYDGEPAGWMVCSDNADAFWIVDVAIVPEKRGAGAGGAALGLLLAEADRAGKPVRLHVNVTNRAIRLYERLGFRRIGGDEVQHLMERSTP